MIVNNSEYINPQLKENNSSVVEVSTNASPKRTSYFNKNNSELMRKNDFNITIKYGVNEQLQKTLSNVKLRNITEEIDASGNPIFNIIEFIAQDII